MVDAAFPFIEVKIDTAGLTPVAQRSAGVIAVVGRSNAGTGDPSIPIRIDTLDDALAKFASIDADENVVETDLYSSLKIAMLQDPKPSKIYGVKVADGNYGAALSSLEAADDVTFVSLANEVSVGALTALKNHVETMSAQGQKRIGVAMVNPTVEKSDNYVRDISAPATEDFTPGDDNVSSLKSDTSRMVMVAARGATATRSRLVRDETTGEETLTEETYTADAATAAMAAMAGYDPHISLVLKKIRGFKMPLVSQYSPTEIKALSEADIIPVIDPDLIVGESLHFAEGRCFTTVASQLYVDIVRTLDDIDFRLKAGLIGLVGDARITKFGMTRLKTSVEGILGPLKRRGVIVDFTVDIPVLAILNTPESAWNDTDRTIVRTARENRTVDLWLTVTYGPSVHRLKVTLVPKF
jgi:hypothetical protein